MNNYLNIVYGREVANNQKMLPLNGISMSRLVGTEYRQTGFAIVFTEMYATIRHSDFCFIPVFGAYVEQDQSGKPVSSKVETAAIILSRDRNGNPIPFDCLRRFAISLGTTYNQDVVLIQAPDENPRYVVTRATIDHALGDTYTELCGEWRLEDLTRDFFTDKANRHGYWDKHWLTFTDQFINPTFTTRNEGHIRYLNGEIFLKPGETKGLI